MSPCISLPCFSHYYYFLCVTINEPILTHSDYLEFIIQSDCLRFHLMAFFCSRTLHYIQLSCLLRLLLTDSSLTFLSFDDGDSFKQLLVRPFVECPSVGLLSNVFLVNGLRLWVWGRKTREVKCHFQYILSKVHTLLMRHQGLC